MRPRFLLPILLIALAGAVPALSSPLDTTPESAALLLPGSGLAAAAAATRRMRSRRASHSTAPIETPARD